MKKQNRLPFLSSEFYENPLATLNIFNQILEKKIKHHLASYESKEILTYSVPDTKENRELFAELITDFDAYIAYQNKENGIAISGDLDLAILKDIHKEVFGYKSEILFDKTIVDVFEGVYGEFVMRSGF